MWLSAALAVLGYVLGYLGGKQHVPQVAGVLGLSLGIAATVMAVYFGLRSYRRALADQELVADRSMIVLLAAQLGNQSDEALTTIAGRGGPAAEAAELILRGRRERQERPRSP